jgi:hypothetical protein
LISFHGLSITPEYRKRGASLFLDGASWLPPSKDSQTLKVTQIRRNVIIPRDGTAQNQHD